MITKNLPKNLDICMIAAIDSNNAIGKDNNLPWPHCAEDMKFFKEQTLGKSIIMGYRTFLSIGAKSLPSRFNIVVKFGVEKPVQEGTNLVFVGSCTDALDYAQSYALDHNQREIMIGGGGSIYEQFLPYAKRLYITHFDYTAEGADVFFPDFSGYAWRMKELQSGTASNGLLYRIMQYDKDCID